MFRTVCRWEASARDSSGQCALGAPRRKGGEIVRSEKEGFNIIIDSRDEGYLKICPRHCICFLNRKYGEMKGYKWKERDMRGRVSIHSSKENLQEVGPCENMGS